MNIDDILYKLNEKQRQVVLAPLGNLLVLAGAGSGKTRVLVHRIAWLLSEKNFYPHSIMAVTFTNKAAEEMRYRIKNLMNFDQDNMWIGTFHSLAHRLLRIHYEDANLPKNFQILDSEDQLRLIKRMINTLNIDEKKHTAHQAMWYINSKKNEGIRHQYIEIYNNPKETIYQRIYQEYQEVCDLSGLVDFSELLLRAHELWIKTPNILQHYKKRFTNIFIDEFQDINQIQYSWMRMLIGNKNNIMIVGDDDQSIYGWRGAKIENIQHFLNDIPDVKIIYLEQNYRSSSNILKAANALISHNGIRFEKSLWTTGIQGEPIFLYCALSDTDEARFVVNCIKINQKKGITLNNCAILYRSNYQSRILEETLLKVHLPYRIFGSMRFFERQEIKDVLAYLRLIVNRNDDVAYERIVNTPTRGIGENTLNIVRKTARHRKLTLWQSSIILLKEKIFSNRSASAIRNFIELINSLEQDISKCELHIQANQVIKNSGLWKMYEQKKENQYYGRLENLKEFVTAASQYNCHEEGQDMIPLKEFLSHVSMESVEKKGNIDQDAVQMMTLHSAKGLEFQQVFIVGMEEGIFPSYMSIEDNSRLEEERRLAYVGITRAMKKLTITYAKTRWLYGKEVFHHPSRFIKELPRDLIKNILF